MDEHALAILKEAESWNWSIMQRIQKSGEKGDKFCTITARLLSCLITESQTLGGTILDQFWANLGKCDPKFKENSELKQILSNFLTLHS
jgi:hypothetical protein